MKTDTTAPTPDRPLTRAEYDQKFVKAGHEPGSKTCDHKHYSFEKHGRYCTCGTIMCDFGD